MSTTDHPRPPPHPDVCLGDQFCRSLNARCYYGVPPEAVPPSQIPLNNSLFCYCNLAYNWAGPDCTELSWKSIVMGVSDIAMGIIMLLLAVAVAIDMVTFTRYSSRYTRTFGAGVVRPLVHAPSSTRLRLPKTTTSGKLASNQGSPSKNRMDMHMVTSILLFLSVTTWFGFILIDVIQNWTLVTCVDEAGVRHTCLLVIYGIFRCMSPIIFLSLVLLLSALMYNASVRANGLSYLPFTSFWTLIVIDTALFTTLVVAAALDDSMIASFSGAFFCAIAGVINLMICYRLRDFSFIKLMLRCSCGRLHGCSKAESTEGQTERPRWTIKQRMMAISMAIVVLDTIIVSCLILRGIFVRNAATAGQVSVASDYIFRWAYIGVMVVYFCLIHYNSKQRVQAMAKRLSTPTPETVLRTEMEAPPKAERSSHSSQ